MIYPLFMVIFCNSDPTKADHRNVDMTVKDIYGGGIGELLHEDIIASSFGKAGKM